MRSRTGQPLAERAAYRSPTPRLQLSEMTPPSASVPPSLAVLVSGGLDSAVLLGAVAAKPRRRPPPVYPLRPVLGVGGTGPPAPIPRCGDDARPAAAARPGNAGARPLRRPLEPDRRGNARRRHARRGRLPARPQRAAAGQGDALVPPARRRRDRPGAAGEQPVPRRHAGLLRRLRGRRQPGRRRPGARPAALFGVAQGGSACAAAAACRWS